MMGLKSEILSAGAVALSSSSILASLVAHLKRSGIISEAEQREIYEDALLMLEEGQGDDDSGVFRTARELIEMHLRPEDDG